jgi:putative redox protein
LVKKHRVWRVPALNFAAMVKATIEYRGDLHCVATHGPSGATLETDAPVDNQGKGEAFSPTDLVATSLGACMATIMGIYARRKSIALESMRIEVTKEMSPPEQGPRRIARLTSEIWMPPGLARDPALEHAALTCPVHQSLHPDIEKPVKFHWSQQT